MKAPFLEVDLGNQRHIVICPDSVLLMVFLKYLKIFFLLIGLIFPLYYSRFASALTVKKKYNLYLATQMPITHTITKSAYLLSNRAKELSDGKINIFVQAGGSMFKDREIPDATMSGGCDIGMSTANTWSRYVRGISFWEVPFLIPPSVDVEKLAEETIPFLNKTLMKKGGKLLGYSFYGYLDCLVTVKRRVKVPSDVNGLKIRIYDRTHLPGFKAFGAAPVVMSSKEVYIAMQRGILEGAISGLSSVVHRRWMEICDNLLIIPNFLSSPSHPFPIVVNRRVWERMEPAAQKILKEAVLEAGRFALKDVIKMKEENLKILETEMNVYKLRVGSDEWIKWKEALFLPGIKSFIRDNPKAGPEIVELIDSLSGNKNEHD